MDLLTSPEAWIALATLTTLEIVLGIDNIVFISVLADPTTAGVSASYALIGDVNIAEPNALIGFTGERITSSSVSEQEQEELRRAQRAEQVLEHGFVDLIVPRNDLRRELSRLLSLLWEDASSPTSESVTAGPLA